MLIHLNTYKQIMNPDGGQIDVLHVDDDQDFLDIAGELLERELDRFNVRMATTVEDGLEIFEAGDIDCIVSDYDFPGMDGLEFLEAVREQVAEFPFIFYTGKGSEEIASEAISAGVTDYLQKAGDPSQYTVLANRIENAVDQHQSLRDLEASQKRLDLFFEQSPLGVIEWDEDFNFVRMNEAGQDILGYTNQDLRGESWEQIVPPKDQPAVEEVVSELLEDAGGYKSVNENVRKNGERIVCEWHNRVVKENGEVVGIFSQFQDVTDREQKETELRKAERRYHSIFDDPNILAGILSPDGRLLEVNSTALGYIDASEEAVTGMRFWDTPWWTDELRTEIQEKVKRAAAGEYVEYEAQLTDSSGAPYYLAGIIRPVTDQDSTVVSVIVTARDITEQKAREDHLEQTTARLEALFENSPDMINIHDMDGNLIDPNPTLCEQTGYTKDELTGMKVWDLDQETNPDAARAIWENMEVGDRHRLEGSFKRKDGTTFPVEVHIRRLDLEGRERFVVISRDITTRQQRERELELYQTMIETIPDGVYALDENLQYIAVNEGMEELTGFSKEELIGNHISIINTDESVERSKENRRKLRESDDNDVFKIERTHYKKDGTPVHCEARFRKLPPAEDGSFWGTAGVLRDITEQERRERELRRQNERLERFVGIVSHDLRNPLNVAQGRVELANETMDDADLETALDALYRMERLIDELLTLAREGKTVQEPDRVELRGLVESCWQTVATDNAELTIATDQVIEADEGRLQQLVENLIGNAIEHGGTSVTVTVGALEDGFYVEDNGPGIPASDREKVFDLGYSTSESGTGFGLSIVEEIADAHGWAVEVTSSDSGGARFELHGVRVFKE